MSAVARQKACVGNFSSDITTQGALSTWRAVGEVEIACKQSTWRVKAEAGAPKRLAQQP